MQLARGLHLPYFPTTITCTTMLAIPLLQLQLKLRIERPLGGVLYRDKFISLCKRLTQDHFLSLKTLVLKETSGSATGRRSKNGTKLGRGHVSFSVLPKTDPGIHFHQQESKECGPRMMQKVLSASVSIAPFFEALDTSRSLLPAHTPPLLLHEVACCQLWTGPRALTPRPQRGTAAAVWS